MGFGEKYAVFLSNIVNCKARPFLPLVLKRAFENGLRLFLTHNLTHEGKFGGGDETGEEDEGFCRPRTKTGGKVYNDFKMPETRLYLVSRPIGKDEVPGSNPGNSSKKRLISSEIGRFSSFFRLYRGLGTQ